MNRRHLMLGCCGAMAVGLFTGLGLKAVGPLRNPCKAALPPDLAGHDLVQSALQGLDATKLVDTHAHLLGTGNPLLVRHALQHGVRVVVAHCASLGQAVDTDQRSAPMRPAFELFTRLMGEKQWHGLLLGDISAVFQSNRNADVWRAVVQRQDWHGRLLHGSDHPLPGVMPLFSPARLQRAGLLAEADVPVLNRVREHNPLLFDLLLKRRLRSGSAQLPAAVFEGAALRSTAKVA